jgi:hypothetical protein
MSPTSRSPSKSASGSSVALAMGSIFTYHYDFGDSWEHRISVKQVRNRDDRYSDGPVAGVEAGERACPPEDAGGVERYHEFVEIYESDPYGEETEQMRTWAGAGIRSRALRSARSERGDHPHARQRLDQVSCRLTLVAAPQRRMTGGGR